MSKPAAGTYPPYFENYISQVPDNTLAEAFINQREVIENFFDSIDESQSDYAYAPGKWTLKEMLQHLIDSERIFCYRALSFARKETQSLPGFEENDYAANSKANQRKWKGLCEEFKAVRRATEIMFNSFDEETLKLSGLANNKSTTVHAIGFIIVGHVYHHKTVIEERYLLETPL